MQQCAESGLRYAVGGEAAKQPVRELLLINLGVGGLARILNMGAIGLRGQQLQTIVSKHRLVSYCNTATQTGSLCAGSTPVGRSPEV